MNLDDLKGKTLDDQTHAALVAHVAELQGQRDVARQESITHRKGLKAKVDELERVTRTAFEKLGIDGAEELETLPDAKGQAEALRQFEAKLKRAERERDEFRTQSERLANERNTERRRAAISSVVSKHNFVDPDVATMLLEHGVEAEGDNLMFKAEGGKLVPLDEGAAWIAKTRPHLVKAQGGSGSGYRPNGGGDGSQRSMTRAAFEALSPEQKAASMRDKVQLTD